MAVERVPGWQNHCLQQHRARGNGDTVQLQDLLPKAAGECSRGGIRRCLVYEHCAGTVLSAAGRRRYGNLEKQGLSYSRGGAEPNTTDAFPDLQSKPGSEELSGSPLNICHKTKNSNHMADV